jgi:adenosine deaminase
VSGPATERDIVTVPKVELHVHLNGSITEATAFELARRHGVDASTALELVDGRYVADWPDFGGFLNSYLLANSLIRTPSDLEHVAAAFARGQAEQHVIWSEAIFTALIQVRSGLDAEDMWAAIRRGFNVVGPTTRLALVVDAIRDNGRAEADATISLVEAADAPIVGLCLTGVDSPEPIETFRVLREGADRLGMGFEVHAGEMGAPASITEALDVLGADRIGHGVAAIHDPAVLDRVIRDQTPLDVCPSSNIAIGLFPSWETHPVRTFWERGVNMTLSSDDPPFFGTTLTDELRRFVGVTGISRPELGELQRRAARNSFAPPAVKAQLIAEIDAWDAAGG